MNREDIIRMAREAGLLVETSDGWDVCMPDNIEQFAALVAAAEREACADIAENWRCNGMPRYDLAEAIRERGES